MSNPTLTAVDLSVLVALADDPADAEALADRVDASPDEADDRLSVLLDNGLVRETDDGYALTDSGRRVARTPDGDAADDSVDAPPEVREALRERGLDADRLDAVLAAFAFLRYWGTATGAEIADGAFGEVPLDHPTADAWWGFVADHLAAVPTVDAPDREGDFWRFDGRPGVADLSDDGRKRLFDHGSPAQYASATEAMAAMDLPDDARRAVAAALAALQGNEAVETGTLRAAVGDAGGATDGSTDPDAEELLATLERLPGVVREGERWRYTLTPDGYASA
ncbi:hypothetical protein [Candidatus Halobonum tyrrellensis]|uniref:HVO-A0261-like N-terminal domain-containing protein n=1 Tax=Candidatus Halobonum tyrrellensis G22 TaxID=1324957 RepID=V4IWP5_9EURY|nr:hypothetical protein [Candidatus Halobonum tyrrellensis]ESP87612.1 hypothetical protein K933_13242 [Candidatus Halobonum tyrrellensis G22]